MMTEFGALTEDEQDQYDRVVALLQTRVVGAVPALARCRFQDRQVAVIVGVVDGSLTDDGKTQIWPEAILVDHELAEQLSIGTEEEGVEVVHHA